MVVIFPPFPSHFPRALGIIAEAAASYLIHSPSAVSALSIGVPSDLREATARPFALRDIRPRIELSRLPFWLPRLSHGCCSSPGGKVDSLETPDSPCLLLSPSEWQTRTACDPVFRADCLGIALRSGRSPSWPHPVFYLTKCCLQPTVSCGPTPPARCQFGC